MSDDSSRLRGLLAEAYKELSCIEAALARPGGIDEMDGLLDLVNRISAELGETDQSTAFEPSTSSGFNTDFLGLITDPQDKSTPPQYVLCGTERYKALMRESGVDPDTPEGEHTLNEARKKARVSNQTVRHPDTSYFGIRVVVSDLVPPDFFQVLPDPVFVLGSDYHPRFDIPGKE